ncbi:hypothetical protein MGSAQ_003191 [marine sediment metagenome]|uniref:Uncharacterized protein n=1 Tax=marine sediment metagenome TaxID=412755 RepID=A0A1B6NPR4_9ZZZZ
MRKNYVIEKKAKWIKKGGSYIFILKALLILTSLKL